MRSGNDGGVAEQTLILGVLSACLNSGGHVADVTRDDDHALAAHTTGYTKVEDLYFRRLYRQVRRLNRRCRGEGFNEAKRTLSFRFLGAEQCGDNLLVNSSHNRGVDYVAVEFRKHVANRRGYVGNGARQNNLGPDLVLAYPYGQKS